MNFILYNTKFIYIIIQIVNLCIKLIEILVIIIKCIILKLTKFS